MRVRRRNLPSGAVRWEMDYAIEGRRTRKTVPGTDGKTLKREAEVLARAHFEREAARAAGLAANPEPMTLAELLARDRARPDASEATRAIIDCHRVPLFRLLGEARQVDALRGADFDLYQQQRMASGISARTINLELCHTLAPALRRAWKAGLLGAEPAAPRRLPERAKKVRWLSAEELPRVIASARSGADGAIRNTRDANDAITFLAATGLRKGEFMGSNRPGLPPGFSWGQVDFAAAKLEVINHKRAGGLRVGARSIPLCRAAMAVLEARRPDPLSKQQQAIPYMHRLNHWIKAAARAAGIDDWETISAHSLRHTFATLALQSGANLRDVAALLGDTVETTARVYLHESEAGMRTAVEAIDAQVFGAYLEHDGLVDPLKAM